MRSHSDRLSCPPALPPAEEVPIDRAALERRLNLIRTFRKDLALRNDLALRKDVSGDADLSGSRPVLPLPAAVQSHLHRGLTFGALHEVAPAFREDVPSAFGFAVALAATALQARAGPALLLVSRRALAGFGGPYGHGLNGLGLDPGRLILIEAARDTEILWALEAALKSNSLTAVVGALAAGIDLTTSRRLHLAAAAGGSFLALLRPQDSIPAGGALTRWRIAPAPAARDPFGSVGNWRWHVALERCRNGRPGAWTMEWNHGAHRFDLAPALADHALSEDAGAGRRALDREPERSLSPLAGRGSA